MKTNFEILNFKLYKLYKLYNPHSQWFLKFVFILDRASSDINIALFSLHISYKLRCVAVRRHTDNTKLLLVCVLILSHSFIFFRFCFFINVYMVVFLFNITIYVFLLLCLMYSYCMFMYLHRASWHSTATLTEVFPCFSLSCKANSRVKPAKTGHGPHSSTIFVLFCVLFVLCRSVYCLCVNVYCTAATGWLPN